MANRYLITAGASVSWTPINTAIWSATSGGATGASVPGASDNVIMDGNSGAGTVTLAYGASVASIDFGAFNGTFLQGGNSVVMGVMIGSGTGTRTYDPGSALIFLTGSGVVWDFDDTTNLTIVTPPSVFMTNVTATDKTFRTGAGAVDYTYILGSSSSSGTYIFDQSNDLTVTNFIMTTGPAKVQLTSGITYNITALTLNGANISSRATLTASTPGAPATISVASGDVECDYVSIMDSTATGGATFTAINSVDVSGNTGWVFTNLPRPLVERLGNRAYTTATSFNGTTTFLAKTTPTGLPTGTTSRSISGWVWLNDPAFGLGAVAGFVTGTNAPVGLIGQFGGTYYYAIDTINVSNNLTLTAAQFNAAFRPRTWHWVYWEFTNTTVTFYVDNVLVKTEAWGVAMNSGAYTALQLGKIRTNTYYFNGCMKDIRIHSGVMTAQERSNEYLFGSVSSTVVSRFLMEDGVGSTTVADSVGSNNLTGTALTWQARNVPTQSRRVAVNQTGSPLLDGSTGYIDFGSHASYALGTAGGFECEFFLDKQQVDTNTANSRFLFCIDNGNSTNWALLAVGNTTTAPIALDMRKAAASTTLTSAAPYGTGLMDSRWHKVACGWDASGALIVLDGALAAMNAVDMTTTLTGTPAMVSGRLGAGFNLRYLTGKVRNFKLLSSKPTVAQCQASYLYNEPYSNLLAAWDCNGIGGTVVPLTSGSGNNGTLTGGVTVVKDTPLKLRQAVNLNMVYNGDFEIVPAFTAVQTGTNFMDGTAAGSTTNIIPGWWCRARTNAMAARFDTSVFRSGAASLKASATNATGTFQISTFNPSSPTLAQMRYNGIRVLPNTSYDLSVWVKTANAPTDSVFASITTYKIDGTGGGLSSSSTSKLTGTNDWTQLTKTVVTGASDYWLQVNLNGTVAGNAFDAWFDDVTLTPTTAIARLPAA